MGIDVPHRMCDIEYHLSATLMRLLLVVWARLVYYVGGRAPLVQKALRPSGGGFGAMAEDPSWPLRYALRGISNAAIALGRSISD